ncbi:MAG TPA: glycoside hydrolase family 38 C-terminal domain-containing protein [Spirochaetia bacterium]|nr:glycoside hydrolase family 38 C-terminal domain-containing protein [Spirochaetia bacterium]
MNDMVAHLLALKSETQGYWAERIVSELQYATVLSRTLGRRHDTLLRSTIESLASLFASTGGITRETVEETEAKLQSIAGDAKSLTVLCASHAHIDMNWMWRFDETTIVALDTFRTILGLMTEYPGFIFSQSQASVYRIVEEHDSEMLKEIRKRVKEGRWEVTASTWVEADKNIPNGESFARHALYARRYLSHLLDIPAESLLIDFEPDTFGHSRNVPEILSRAGVRWYYHCRGHDEHTLYRWQAPSGSQIIVYRDPFWYNGEVSPSMALAVPDFCKKHGLTSMLRLYGVGDHGGGPTRRDIERIVDMDSWPVFPRFRFSPLKDFYAAAEANAEKLPVVNKELNFVFTGCYTTQARIKMANRVSEASLVDAETYASLAALAAAAPYHTSQFARAWQMTLFNHFHDIVTGSGVVDTREYALGQFQRVLAIASSEASSALRHIAIHVDTSSLGDPKEDARSTVSEGGGAGFGVADFRLSMVERGRGKIRVLHVFNPSPWQRSEAVEAIVWDWDGDRSRVQVTDGTGAPIQHQVLPNEPLPNVGMVYWGHTHLRVLMNVTVPGCGYATYRLCESLPSELPIPFPTDPRLERVQSTVLENEKIRAVFHPVTAALVSLVDKESGEEMVDGNRDGGVFRLVREDDAKGMTAWIVGRWMSVQSAHQGVKLSAVSGGSDDLRQWLTYEMSIASSRLKATVSLDRGSAALCWSVECEWLELGRKGEGVPQLNFFLPLAAESKNFRYDVPFGTADRAPVDMDLPANSWVLAVPKKAGHKSVLLVADQKHAFRCIDNSVSLTLLRSSYDPDPYPELGLHRFSFSVEVTEGSSSARVARRAQVRAHALTCVSGTIHAGALPLSQGFLEAEEGSAICSAVKMAEDSEAGGVVVRLYETDGRKGAATLRFFCAPSGAQAVDLNEKPLADGPAVSVKGSSVSVEMEPHAVTTILVRFQGCRE